MNQISDLKHNQKHYKDLKMETSEIVGIVYSLNEENISFCKNSLKKLSVEVKTVRSSAEFEHAINNHYFNLMLIDLNLDYIDAISLVKDLRKGGNKSIIIIYSDKQDDFLVVNSFDAGADNFISLPINPYIFQLKVSAHLKEAKEKNINTKRLFMDEEKFKVTLNNKDYSLQPKDFFLLKLLNSFPNKQFSRQEIIAKIWKNKPNLKRNLIEVHICRLRRLLGKDIIITHPKIGYSINFIVQEKIRN